MIWCGSCGVVVAAPWRGVGQATGSNVRGYSITVAVCVWTVGATDVLSLNVSRGRMLRGRFGRAESACGRPTRTSTAAYGQQIAVTSSRRRSVSHSCNVQRRLQIAADSGSDLLPRGVQTKQQARARVCSASARKGEHT